MSCFVLTFFVWWVMSSVFLRQPWSRGNWFKCVAVGCSEAPLRIRAHETHACSGILSTVRRRPLFEFSKAFGALVRSWGAWLTEMVDERWMLDVSLLLFVLSLRRARIFFGGKAVD